MKNQFAEYAGYKARKPNPYIPGGWLVLYDGKEQGLDIEGGKWVTVCETHGAICNHKTLQNAKDNLPYADWCEDCMEIANNEKAN